MASSGCIDRMRPSIPSSKLAYSLPLSERWTLNAFVHYEYLSDQIADSPIVSDPSVVTAFVGLNFKVF